MSDYSLMNPDHLKKEIRDIELYVIPTSCKAAQLVCEDADRIIDYCRDTYNNGEPTTLSVAQVSDLIQTLSRHRLDTFVHYANPETFTLKVYNQLLKDRRWFIGSKLRFLAK